jgi:hypothetical protein
MTVMFDGQVIVTGVELLGGGCSPMVPGSVTDGDQVWPPSKLTSVKISKKLSI